MHDIVQVPRGVEMVNIWIIVKKELSDVISNRSFQLASIIFIIYMVLVGVSSANAYYNQRIFYSTYLIFDPVGELVIIGNIAPPILSLGAFVAISFSFTSMNKERANGSLKVLLSYPVYRDQVILGKLFAGFLLISVITLTSMSVSLTLYLLLTNIVFTLELMLRFISVMLLGLLFLLSFLGIGEFFSILFVDAKKTLITMFLVVGFFNSEVFTVLGQIISRILFGNRVFELAHKAMNAGTDWLPPGLPSLLGSLNPSWGLRDMADKLGVSSKVLFTDGVVSIVSNNFSSVIFEHLGSIIVLLLIPIISFSASYIFFMKKDIV